MFIYRRLYKDVMDVANVIKNMEFAETDECIRFTFFDETDPNWSRVIDIREISFEDCDLDSLFIKNGNLAAFIRKPIQEAIRNNHSIEIKCCELDRF